jgi:hypothetical protein
MNKLNASVFHIPMPDKIKRLPISKEGYPTPWFAATIGGERDFRVADTEKFYAAVKRSLCWVCGQQLGQYKVFVLGPMCVVNRNTAEPPCHLECAEYSAKACPFLTRPRMRRNAADLPEGAKWSESGIRRNPGAVALWSTKTFKTYRNHVDGGTLFEIGDPEKILWFAEGRKATRAEVDESVRTGLPFLEEMAKKEGPEAEVALAKMLRECEPLWPTP